MRLPCLLAVWWLVAGIANAQDVRQHTRLDPRGTRVTQSQAEALTLTLGTASVRPVQTWIRTAGTIDKTGKVLRGSLSGPEAALVKVGQRVRIRSGALAGMEGVLMGTRGQRQLVVSISTIQRSVSLAIEGYDVEPI